MPAYLVAVVNVKDQDAYLEYAKRANVAAGKYGGKFLLRGAPKEVLEGIPPGGRVVVSQWESLEQAKKYYASPEYQEAKKHRAGVAEAAIMLFEGV